MRRDPGRGRRPSGTVGFECALIRVSRLPTTHSGWRQYDYVVESERKRQQGDKQGEKGEKAKESARAGPRGRGVASAPAQVL